jgi:hypothetical protein
MTTTDDWNFFKPFIFCIAILLLINAILYFSGAAALALPTTGAATLIGSNNVTIPVTGITGTQVWVNWGQNPGGECWNVPNQTPSAGSASITISGAPLLGFTKYYAVACDSTGCGNEISFTTLQVTPIQVTNYGAGYRNLTESRFNMILVGGTLFRAYTTLMPASVVFGLLFGVITIGMWQRTKSVRLIGILMMIASPFIVMSGAGLMLGVPLAEQALGQTLLAAGLAGVFLSFIKP